MKRFERLLADLRELPGTKLRLAYKGGEAVVSFPDGRTQTIHVRRAGESYLMTSRVIAAPRRPTWNRPISHARSGPGIV